VGVSTRLFTFLSYLKKVQPEEAPSLATAPKGLTTDLSDLINADSGFLKNLANFIDRSIKNIQFVLSYFKILIL